MMSDWPHHGCPIRWPRLQGALVPALLFLVTACAGPPTSQGEGTDRAGTTDLIDSEPPSIRGTITDADTRSIRVEEEPADDSGSAKALVRMAGDIPIRFADGAPASIGDLRVGSIVSVWFTGPVAESYPVQAVAGAIRIEVPAGGEGQ